jgi:signal transduction histidine kinase
MTRLQVNPAAPSADYRAWRHQFLLSRLRLALWIAFPCFIVVAIHSLYIVLMQGEKFAADILKIYGSSTLADNLRMATIVTCAVSISLLAIALALLHTRWGERHLVVIFLFTSWSLNGFVNQIIDTFFGTPAVPDIVVFLAIAILVPVHWRLHLLAQAVPITYFAIGYPLLGLTQIGDRSIYDIYELRTFIDLFWVCLISILTVYLYERLRQSEFEARRHLQVLIYSVSHDLQTPVMGTSMLLKSLLRAPQEQITLHRSILEQMLEGSDRQSTLINSLLEAHHAEAQILQLQRQPLALSPLIASVLTNLQPLLTQHQVQLSDRISSALPLVDADAHQLWRVFSNLIINALKHNPNGIHLTLDAEIIYAKLLYPKSQLNPPKSKIKNSKSKIQTPLLRCVVQDNGVGIPPEQSQHLFELYVRGERARYMPGLGLGLYLCRQIIQAHGGEIGVISRPGAGATFWFTLPLA